VVIVIVTSIVTVNVTNTIVAILKFKELTRLFPNNFVPVALLIGFFIFSKLTEL